MPVALRDTQASFAGGLNTVTEPSEVRQDQFLYGRNARLTEYGALTKRYGSVGLASGALTYAALNGYCWVKADGTAELLMNCTDGHLWGLNPLAAVASQAWAQLSTGPAPLSLTVPATFAEFLNTAGDEVVFISEGGISVWDGSAPLSPKGNYPDAAGIRFIKVHNQRLWGVGDPARPNELLFSSLNDGETLGETAAGGGSIIVRTFGDERLVALASAGSSLLIFHERGLSRLTGYGQDDITLQPEGISSETGTIAPLSVVEVDGAVYFISDRGVFVANEGAVRPVGTPDKPDPILPLLASLTPTQLADVRGVLSRKSQEVWFRIPGVGTYVYHLILGAWSGPWDGMYASAACLVRSSVASYAESYVIVVTGDGTKLALVADISGVGTEAATLAAPSSGTAIPLEVRLRRLTFGDDTVAKSFRFAYFTAILAGGVAMDVSWETNFDQYPDTTVLGALVGVWTDTRYWDVGRWSTNVSAQNYRFDIFGLGYYVDVTLSHAGTDTPVLTRFSIDAYALGRR